MTPLRVAATLSAPLFLAVASPAAWADADDADLVYECALALDFAAKNGMQLPVTGASVMTRFAEVTGNNKVLRRQAEQAVDATWKDYKKQNGSDELDKYVLLVAQDCAEQYAQGSGQQATQQQGQLNALGTLTAASLRAYADRTGDHGAVADYLVYHYPSGKDLFKDNADGDLLGKIIVEVGASGLRRWSDEAIYAIANKFYWQYNPPATRLVFAEYQRRMRMRRQTETEAQQWAQRAASDRAQQARQATAKPVGSLGNGCESRKLIDQRGVVTATYSVCRK